MHAIHQTILFGMLHAPMQAMPPEPVDDALSHLLQLADAPRQLRLHTSGFQLQGTSGSRLDPSHTFHAYEQAWLEGRAADYVQVSHAAWNRGDWALELGLPSLDGTSESIPRLGLYWSDGRGLQVDVMTTEVRLISKFWGLGELFLPQQFFAYYLDSPLAAIAQRERGRGRLEHVLHEDGGLQLRFPCDPHGDLDPSELESAAHLPYLVLEFEATDSGTGQRLESVAYETEAGGIVNEIRLTQWDEAASVPTPLMAEYELHLGAQPLTDPGEQRRMTFFVELQHSATPLLDGQSLYELASAVGLLSVEDTWFSSLASLNLVAQGAAEEFRSDARMAELREQERVLLEERLLGALDQSRARLRDAGASWPGVGPEAIQSELLDRIDPVELSDRYCSQLSMAVLRRLNGEAASMESILERYPLDLLPLDQVARALEEAGLEYEVVRVEEGDDFAWIGDEPFLAVLGSNPAAAHLAVVKRIAEDNLRMWSPPGQLQFVEPQSLPAQVEQGVYLVPRAWVQRNALDSRALRFAPLILLVVLGAGLLRQRKRQLASAASLGLVGLLFLAGCSESAASPSSSDPNSETTSSSSAADDPAAAPLLELLGGTPSFEVQLEERRPAFIEIRNPGPEPVELLGGSASCTCLRFRGEVEGSVGPGETRSLALQLIGDKPGQGERTLFVRAGRGERQEVLRIQVHIAVLAPLIVTPRHLMVQASAGELVPDAFQVTLVEGDLAESDQLEVWLEPSLASCELGVADEVEWNAAPSAIVPVSVAIPAELESGVHLVEVVARVGPLGEELRRPLTLWVSES